MPSLITIDPQRPDPQALERAARVLEAGGLVAFPTETFYGIAADTASAQGLDRLARLKSRQADKPFPLILAEAGQLGALVEQVPELAAELMQRHWPGPLTLVMAARAGLHPRLVSAQGGVGVRVSPWACASGLARALGRAITATSANLAGGPPPRRAADLDPRLARALDLVLDGGPTPGGAPSTVLDVRCHPPLLLRPGPVAITEAVSPEPGSKG